MKSLLNQAVVEETIQRINNLAPNTQPLWGKMNVAQMLAHCQIPLQVALGKLKLKRMLMGILLGPLAKKVVLSEKPFKKNLPTDRTFVMDSSKNFDEEKNKLIDLIREFFNAGVDGVGKDKHPFFGRMTPIQWSTSSWKHLDHHLRQFGI